MYYALDISYVVFSIIVFVIMLIHLSAHKNYYNLDETFKCLHSEMPDEMT